jgi:hypothetical protein
MLRANRKFQCSWRTIQVATDTVYMTCLGVTRGGRPFVPVARHTIAKSNYASNIVVVDRLRLSRTSTATFVRYLSTTKRASSDTTSVGGKGEDTNIAASSSSSARNSHAVTGQESRQNGTVTKSTNTSKKIRSLQLLLLGLIVMYVAYTGVSRDWMLLGPRRGIYFWWRIRPLMWKYIYHMM